MSELRPTIIESDAPGLTYQQTYYRVLEAVLRRRTLIGGQLEDARAHTCAVGAYFKESRIPIDIRAIDEIAAYNDSFPKLSEQQRWRRVRNWLRFRIKQLKK